MKVSDGMRLAPSHERSSHPPWCALRADGGEWGNDVRTKKRPHYTTAELPSEVRKEKQKQQKQQWHERRAMVETDGATLYDFHLNRCAAERLATNASPLSKPPPLAEQLRCGLCTRLCLCAATDRCGPEFEGSAYRFYGKVCSRCALGAAKPKGQSLQGVGPRARYDPACGADHYDQLKIEHGREPKIAHVRSGYRHPLMQHDSDE